jgi:hypothetical protein
MWNEQKTFLTSQLSSDETLLWSGQPKQGLVFRFGDLNYLFVIGFGILWMTVCCPKRGLPVLRRDFCYPHIAFGVYGLTGRYFVNSKQRAKTYYGVTGERVIIVSGLFSKQVKSLPLKFMTDISIDEKSDGTGTITFGPSEASTSWLTNIFSRKEEIVYPSFDLIRDAKRVYEIIRHAQKNNP